MQDVVALFQDYLVLENATTKFQEFPGFPGRTHMNPVRLGVAKVGEIYNVHL